MSHLTKDAKDGWQRMLVLPGGPGYAEAPGVGACVRFAVPGVGASPPPGVMVAVPGVKP